MGDYISYNTWINGIENNFNYFNPAPPYKEEFEGELKVEKEQFPIIAEGIRCPYQQTVLTIEELNKAVDCGFNVVSNQAIGRDFIAGSLINASKVHVSLMFNNALFYTNRKYPGQGLRDVLEEGIDAFGGINLKDEPTYCEIIGDPDSDNSDIVDTDHHTINDLRNDYRNLINQHLNKIYTLNLVGSPVEKFMPSKGDPIDKYTQYLEAFQENFKPAVFSYDLYPISEISSLLYEGTGVSVEGQDGDIIVNNEGFYKDFEIYRAISTAHERPFWSFCQSLAFMDISRNLYRPIALESYLRFEAFNAIAYGAKGIRYWTFGVIENYNNECYFSGLLNRRNEKTASWFFAKKVNREIQKYSEIFLKGTVSRTHVVSSFPLLSEKLNITINTSSYKHEVIVSEINVKGDTDYLLIVNKSPLDYVKISITTKLVSVTEMTPSKSHGPENQKLNLGTNVRTLIPGGFILLKKTLTILGPALNS